MKHNPSTLICHQRSAGFFPISYVKHPIFHLENFERYILVRHYILLCHFRHFLHSLLYILWSALHSLKMFHHFSEQRLHAATAGMVPCGGSAFGQPPSGGGLSLLLQRILRRSAVQSGQLFRRQCKPSVKVQYTSVLMDIKRLNDFVPYTRFLS